MKKCNFILMITVFTLIIAIISFAGCGSNSPAAGQPAQTPQSSPLPSQSPPSFGQFMVCLDPGHPSETSAGAEAKDLKEVEVNWQVALVLEQLLKDEGIPVTMTKHSLEQKVTNKDRAIIANRANSTLLLRLHCDIGGGTRKGITFYYPNGRGTKDDKTGPSDEIMLRSKEAAEKIHIKTIEKLKSCSYRDDNGFKGESETLVGSHQGALTGSIYSEVPVVTVEMVFLDNQKDADFIGSPSGRQTMAEALKEGIVAYLSTL